MLRRALARLDAAGLRGWRRGVLEPFAAEEHTHSVRGVELVLATRQNARLAMMETGDTTGTAIWGSALLLSRVLEAREAQSPELRGASVLELGSGTGLVGLACAALGARDVTLTDRAALHSHCSHGADGELHVGPPVRDRFTLDLLAANAAANAAVLPDCALAVRELEWGDDEHLAAARAAAPPGGHDVIVGSDLAYHGDCVPLLLSTLQALMAEKTIAYLAIPERKLLRNTAEDFATMAGGFCLGATVVHRERWFTVLRLRLRQAPPSG